MILLSENANGIRVWASSNEWLGEGGLICVFPLLLVIDEINKVTAAFFVCLHRFFSLFQFKLFVSQHFFYSFIPYPWNLYRIDKSCFFATIRILRMDDPHTCLNCLPYKYGEYVCRLNAMRQPTKQKESRQFRISFCFARNFQASEFA